MLRLQLPLLGLLGFLYSASAMGLPLSGDILKLGLGNWTFTQLVYWADRFLSQGEDAANGLSAPAPLPVPGSVFFFGLAAAGLYISSFPGQLIFPASGMLILFLYSFPGLGRLRLKNFFFSKMLVNAFIFFSAVVLSPAIFRYGLSWHVLRAAAVSSTYVLPLVLCVTLLLDVRDVKGDAAAGVRTIPVLIGARAAAFIIAAVSALLFAAAALQGSVYGAVFCLVLSAGAVFSAGRGRAYFESCIIALNLVSAAFLLRRAFSL